jgi:hypothetical protein
VLLLSPQQYGISLEAGLVMSKLVIHHHGHGKWFGIGWLFSHGYLHFTPAYFQQGYAYG